MEAKGNVAVFIDTSIGTRIAMQVPPDSTAGILMKELEKTHLGCFPEFGQIKVYSLTVKRKSNLYHLSESFPLNFIFRCSNQPSFFYSEAWHKNDPDSRHNCSKPPNSSIISNSNKDVSSCCDRICSPGSIPVSRNSTENICPVLSIETIVADNVGEKSPLEHVSRGNWNLSVSPDFTGKIPLNTFPASWGSNVSVNEPDRYNRSRRVGKRLIEALNRIQVQAKRSSPIMSLSKSKARASFGGNSGSLAKFGVFEISDSED